MNLLTVWEIDSFEGGKGSRASYLQNIGDEFSKNVNCYVHVISLSSEAARQNLNNGKIPDLISYGAGTYGIENYITDKIISHIWAHGGYCFIAKEENADFSDISAQNTVINGGTENFAGAATLFSGVEGANIEKPTGAYVSLLNGKYKYLLGTQRDIYRLTTRGATFKIKPITEFNDLFQLISVTSENPKNSHYANEFISFLQSKSDNLKNLGLMGEVRLYDDVMSQMECIDYKYRIDSPVSKNAREEFERAILHSDINLLKNLFK